MTDKQRCAWSESEDMLEYHDKEWGVPVHDDRKIFEFLVLEGAQAGLSWQTILKRREGEGYRKAFANFDPKKVSKYTDKDEKRLMNDSGIIRNKLKIKATITNAQNFLKVQKEFGSFDKYIWSFVGGKAIKNKFKSLKEIPAVTKEAETLSKDLKKRGFSFVGPTIIYAHMQATGMVNDHEVSCFRYNQV